MGTEREPEIKYKLGVSLFAVVVLLYIVTAAYFILFAQPPAQPQALFTMTEVEQLKLANLQLRRRTLDAEYAANMGQLTLDESAYADAVLQAHPGAGVFFDSRTISWVRKVGPVGASGGTGTR